MEDAGHKQILVVKRHAGHQENHHGGAWKIAFADFMTAMMALFLVLWLMSSTSEKTKHTVAQYFNPVKLVEMSTLKKGFHDPKDTEMGTGSSPKEPRSDADPKKTKPMAPRAIDSKASGDREVTAESEAALFRDPYAVLAEIAAAAPQKEEQKIAGKRAVAQPDGALFSDPFADAPQEQPEVVADAPALAQKAGSDSLEQGDEQRAPAARDDVQGPAAGSPATEEQKEQNPRQGPASDASRLKEASGLKPEILRALTGGAAAQAIPHIEVEETPEGILISLTDDAKFSMFAIGSAKPNPETVQAIEKVGRVLNSAAGKIIIRGHTDGRTYKSAVYDNWRLSGARAQIALYMLTRGGVSEKRIERVEGYADHRLKVPGNPNASENRRIEVLLRKD